MAIASGERADIELLFGVKGGGTIAGESGKRIKDEIDSIVKDINENPLKISVELSQDAIASFRTQLSQLTEHAQAQARAIQEAYRGIEFPQIPNGNPGEEGSSGRTGSRRTRNRPIEQDTVGYYNAITRLEKLQTSIRENTRRWSEAEYGTSYEEYENLIGQLERLDELRDRLESGTLSARDFNRELSHISAVAAQSANAIHENEENIRFVDNLAQGVRGYNQAIISVNSKLVEVRKNVEAWSAAADGSTAGEYTRLQAQIAALEELRGSLERGELTAEEFAETFGVIKREVSSSAEAIKRASMAFEAGTEIKQYNDQLDKVNTLLVKTKKSLTEWTAAKNGTSSDSYHGLEQTVTTLEEMRAELLSGGVALRDFDRRFDLASASAKQFSANIELAGENVKSTSNKIGDLFKIIGISFSIADAFRKVIEIGREMVDVVTDIDTAMTELKKVTDETDAAYDRFLTRAEPRARALGATVADTVSATADFARLGHGLNAASALADAALVYKNVGDGIEDITTASESIISTMQAFGVEAENAMTIVDSFNNVGNNFAVSSKGIGEALLNSAAALHAAGNNIHESVALIAAANTTIQDPGRVGTALKTMSMYMRAAKTEAEEAGLSTENMADSVSELREELLALTGNRVDIMADVDAGEYKSTVEILRDLSEVWGDLSDTTKTNITELIGGGVRNANIIASLMQNFSIVEDAMKTSAESAGSALAENEKYLDSVAGKIAQLQTSIEVLYTTILDSELVKFGFTVADGLTRVATILADISFDNIFSTLTTLGGVSGGIAFFKNLD